MTAMSDRDDRLEIRDLVENWAVWRDAGDWERFRSVWHDDGRMMATWFQGSGDEFIRVSREGFERGVSILHFLGGTSIDLAGDRAIAQTKMTISQRASVDGVECDVLCTGRFYDFLERRGGRWGIVLRQPIYEKDRLDPLDPAASLTLDRKLLDRFPVGYRHLAYAQTRIGFDVKPDMPGLVGPEVEALYARGARWLAGGPPGSSYSSPAGRRTRLTSRRARRARAGRARPRRCRAGTRPTAGRTRRPESTRPPRRSAAAPAATASRADGRGSGRRGCRRASGRTWRRVTELTRRYQHRSAAGASRRSRRRPGRTGSPRARRRSRGQRPEPHRAASTAAESDKPPERLAAASERRLHRAERAAGRAGAMLVTEMEGRGPVSAGDDALLQTLGWTRPRAVAMLKKLEAEEIVPSLDERADGPGRPRRLYELLPASRFAA